MKLAIMQPYLFPYVGYFQLARLVDRFIFYDDVNFMKGGWINRNRLLIAGRTSWFTLPLQGASPYCKINEIRVQPGDTWRRKLLASVRHSYSKAPYFEPTYALLARVLESSESSLAKLARDSVTQVADYLGLNTEFVSAAGRYDNTTLRGSNRVLDICCREGATEYYNLPGGRLLYSTEAFSEQGVELRFVQPRLAEYRQFRTPFEPGLSILDVLMFNDAISTRRLLAGHECE